MPLLNLAQSGPERSTRFGRENYFIELGPSVSQNGPFYTTAEISNTCNWYVPKSGFSRNSKSPLLTAVAGLQSTVLNATKNEFLTKFVKGALKLTENLQEMISNGVAF